MTMLCMLCMACACTGGDHECDGRCHPFRPCQAWAPPAQAGSGGAR